MNSFDLEITTPDATHPARAFVFLDVPAQEGRMTILAGHQPFLGTVRSGIVRATQKEGAEERWQIEGGTLRVTCELVTLLVREATLLEPSR